MSKISAGENSDRRGPCITVLMPVFNGGSHLAQQVESILRQDVVDLSLMAIDDGSSDESHRLLMEMARRDSRIIVSRHDSNRGLIQTIGELLAEVRSPYFALADQDDIWDRSKLSTSIEFLCTENVKLVYSDVRVIDSTGIVTVERYLRKNGIKSIEGSNPLPFVFRNPAIGHTIVSTVDVAHLAKDIPDGLVFHEAWLVAAACALGQVRFIDAALGSYRVHSSNVVGPKSGGLRRRTKTIANLRRLEMRQRIRTVGLKAVASLHPEFTGIADAYSTDGPRRVLLAPRVVIVLLRQAREIGLMPIMIEIGAFLLHGLRHRKANMSSNTEG